MTDYDFNGQVAVVTGGAQGIGRAVAERLARDGATIAVWDMNPAAEAPEGGMACACDVADAASVKAALGATLAAHGRIDILVNSAGIAGPVALVEDYADADWQRVIDIDLTGTFNVNKAVLPGMKAQGYGRIVNVASVAGKEGNPKAAAYAAAKAGVIGFTKAIAKECADLDIAINCITPAAARTPILDQLTEEFIEFMRSKIPRGRFVEVTEIADMIAWMVSRDCSFTTGSVFDISGGRATY
jgi:3-oxoacyl-[acyl-carrier protein] reductase